MRNKVAKMLCRHFGKSKLAKRNWNKTPRKMHAAMKASFGVFVLLLLVGCGTPMQEAYSKSPYTPDSFFYENYRDRHMKDDGHGFGLNWNLKP